MFDELTRHPSRRQFSHAQYFMQDSFLMLNISCAIFWDSYCLSYFAHLQSAVCQYEIVNFFTLFSVIADFGAPWRGSSKTDVRPRWNSLNQFLTVAIEGEESPYTASKRSLISLRDFPSKNMNRITDRYCSLPIFVKSMPVSTSGQNKTTNPIRLRFW